MEAEIYLHRHKTIIRACRGKRLLKDKSKIVQPEGTNGAGPSSGDKIQKLSDDGGAGSSHGHAGNETEDDLDALRKLRDLGQVRTVLLKRRDPKEGLGISITGG